MGAVVRNITGDFINNAIRGSSIIRGGAVYLEGATVGNITGDFIGNSVTTSSTSWMYGGALFLVNGASVQNIEGNFIGNSINASRAYGGAIELRPGTSIKNITGKFIDNKSNGGDYANGGAIQNEGSIDNINADFINNTAKSSVGSKGAAVSNYGTIASLHGTFINNQTDGGDETQGGAIFNNGNITNGIINSSFYNNYAKSVSGAKGGAIISYKDIIISNAGDSIFNGNYVENNGIKASNAIYMIGSNLNVHTQDSGRLIMNDGINGEKGYNINITGDNSGIFQLNNQISNATSVSIADTHFVIGKYNNSISPELSGVGNFDSNTNLSLNNVIFDINNGFISEINIKDYNANNTNLYLNIKKENSGWVSDKLNISGDIRGQTKLVVYSLSSTANFTDGESVVFAEAPNDTLQINDAFLVHRIYGDPYMWEAVRNAEGTEAGSVWYLRHMSNLNPDYDHPEEPDPEEPNEPDPEVPQISLLLNLSPILVYKVPL